jgi:hypothetical protein
MLTLHHKTNFLPEYREEVYVIYLMSELNQREPNW